MSDFDIKNKYIMIGGLYAVENEAQFEKVGLHVSDDGKNYNWKHFGLYRCFTVLTQHTYGTKEELLFILGVMSTHKEEMETNTHEFYKTFTKTREMAYKLAEEDTFKEMKRIALLEGIEIDAETSNEAYNKYFSNSNKFMADNYFYFYKIGKALFHECEIVSGILNF